jgi:hypothetical protein
VAAHVLAAMQVVVATTDQLNDTRFDAPMALESAPRR